METATPTQDISQLYREFCQLLDLETELKLISSISSPIPTLEEAKQALLQIRETYPRTVFECESGSLQSKLGGIRWRGPIPLPIITQEPQLVFIDISYPEPKEPEITRQETITYNRGHYPLGKPFKEFSEEWRKAYTDIKHILSRVTSPCSDFDQVRRLIGTNQPLSQNCPCLEDSLTPSY